MYCGEEYENLNTCPVCSALQYKIKWEDPSDVEGDPSTMFEVTLSWCGDTRKEERKQDEMLRHPTNGSQ